jgi:hypothetical protein
VITDFSVRPIVFGTGVALDRGVELSFQSHVNPFSIFFNENPCEDDNPVAPKRDATLADVRTEGTGHIQSANGDDGIVNRSMAEPDVLAVIEEEKATLRRPIEECEKLVVDLKDTRSKQKATIHAIVPRDVKHGTRQYSLWPIG